MDYKKIIYKSFRVTEQLKDRGQLATYIPELARVDPSMFGVHMITMDGKHYGLGDHQQKFSIQSIAKVLSLTLAYHLLGEKFGSAWELNHPEQNSIL